MSLKHPTNQPQRWRFYQIFALKHLSGEIDEANAACHIWANSEESKMLREVLPASTSVQCHVCESTKEESDLPLRTRIRKWLTASRTGEGGMRLLDGLRNFGRTARRLLRVARRTTNAFSEIDETHPLHSSQRTEPLVLVQTKFPRSWAPVPDSTDLEISSTWYDHYFGDSPAQLSVHGYQTGWLTSMVPGSEQAAQWDEVKQTQSIPDATPWMVLTYSGAWQIAWHRLKWAIIYVYLFVWRQVQSEWTYEGIPVGHWFKDAYRWAWCTDAFVDVERYRHACMSLKPDTVLYRDEFYITSGRRLSAGAKGYTMLVGVQHGMIPQEHTVYQWHKNDIQVSNFEGDSDHVHYVPAPDWFASFGSHYVEQFAEWDGYPASRVIPVGGLRHDVLVEQFDLHAQRGVRASQKSELREAYNLPPERPVLLLCTGTAETAEEWFTMVLEALEQQTLDAHIIVKLHQYHGGEDAVRRVAERRAFEDFSLYTEDIYPLIAASDVLIGGASTTILEGKLFGLDCVAICATKAYTPYPFSQDDLAWLAANSEDMAKGLKRAIKNEEITEDSLIKHLNNRDKSSVYRLSNLINNRGYE